MREIFVELWPVPRRSGFLESGLTSIRSPGLYYPIRYTRAEFSDHVQRLPVEQEERHGLSLGALSRNTAVNAEWDF